MYYEGTVQGVGFRYTVRGIAGGHAVCGFVRNLADGRVHLRAEGAPADLDRFLTAVRARMDHNITAVESSTLTATGEYSEFEIR